MSPEESNHASSHPDSESLEEPDRTPESQAEPEADFESDTLQSAQDKIMSELTRLKDSELVSPILSLCLKLTPRTSGQDVSYPFIGKPDRNLYRDYYEIIQYPYEAFKKEFVVPTAGRIHPEPPHILHGSPLKRRSAMYGETLGNITKTTAISLFSREFWR